MQVIGRWGGMGSVAALVWLELVTAASLSLRCACR